MIRSFCLFALSVLLVGDISPLYGALIRLPTTGGPLYVRVRADNPEDAAKRIRKVFCYGEDCIIRAPTLIEPE